MQNFRALGAPPPDPRASGGWMLGFWDGMDQKYPQEVCARSRTLIINMQNFEIIQNLYS